MRNAEKDKMQMHARRETILATAFRLFAEKGIEMVSMQQIADACGIGVATLYRYYNTKQLLVLAVGTRGWTEYYKHVQQLYEDGNAASMTAAEELAFSLDVFTDLYLNHKDELRFNQNFNNYIQHEGITREQMAPYMRAIGNFYEMYRRVYEKGKVDGTIRTDLSEKQLFAVTTHIMLAVAVRYAQGLIYAAEREEDRTREFELLKNMILHEVVVQ